VAVVVTSPTASAPRAFEEFLKAVALAVETATVPGAGSAESNQSQNLSSPSDNMSGLTGWNSSRSPSGSRSRTESQESLA
jgi:hypothetical protein